jgi:hypothetical protein
MHNFIKIGDFNFSKLYYQKIEILFSKIEIDNKPQTVSCKKMLRRSKRIAKSTNEKDTVLKTLQRLTNINRYYSENGGNISNCIYNLNLLYDIVYRDFYTIHHEIHLSNTHKEDSFIKLISTIAERGDVLISQILEKQERGEIINAKTFIKNILRTNEKIQKYIQKYNEEKNNMFCILSSKIGVDIIPMINAYL